MIQAPGPGAHTNTKLELLTEAIESLIIEVVKAVTSKGSPGSFKAVVDARKTLHDALADFTKPSLRIVGGTDKE